MTRLPFQDHPPESTVLTAYDEAHLADYLRLIDADDEGADWEEVAAAIFGLDASSEPARARAVHDKHLARARWMTEIGYAYLLSPNRVV